VVEELAAVTIRDAIRWAEAFQGETANEFRTGLYVIARRRRIDYLRKKRVDTTSFVFEGSETDEEKEFGSGDPLDAIDSMSVFNQAFSELNKDSHKLVILLNLYGYSYAEIAEKVTSQLAGSGDDPMSENNVSQIISRFNKRLDELLDDD
jgi:RNA polymerase sigma factor (sigma-70 family)